jgi:hypothetical protein
MVKVYVQIDGADESRLHGRRERLYETHTFGSFFREVVFIRFQERSLNVTAANVPLQPVSDTRRQARRGLALYFAIVVPLTAVFEAILIGTGNPLWVFTLMWVPAAGGLDSGTSRPS